jgi:proteasome activator subunit 4
MFGRLLHEVASRSDDVDARQSWRVRLKVLPLLQVFYFRQMPLIRDAKGIELLDAVCHCLDDEVIEVREMAARTLTGLLRVSPRRSVLTLKARFERLLRGPPLPARASAAEVRQRHAAVLGCCALVDAFPHTVERWAPALLTGVIAEHTYDPLPISGTVRRCAGAFRRTHQDTWHEDKLRFSEEQMVALSTLLTGSSYYA